MKRIGRREVWSLPEVTAAVWRRFEDIPPVWVEAEVQNLGRRGGQIYFTLADDDQIDASMNAVVFDRLPARPADGARVQAYGKVEFWRPRSQVRMRVERLELAGEGLLRAQIAALRERLAADGLLEAARKRTLPLLPRRVGLVTSAQGAARDDFLRNLWARHPQADVLLVDAPVQGDTAPRAIVAALRHLDCTPEVDVIVVTRGGGPLEDLMAFNSEDVCRAVAGCRTPVVSGVGHERDVTLCDLVADVRVSTPTAAAEAVVPDVGALRAGLSGAGAAMARGLGRARREAEAAVAARRRDLVRALRLRGERSAERVEGLARRLAPAAARLAGRAPGDLDARRQALERAVAARAESAAAGLRRSADLLALLSPRRTVARGYAIVRTAPEGRVLTAAGAARPGDALEVEMHDGRLPVRVEGGTT